MHIITNKIIRIPLLSIVAGIILALLERLILMPMYMDFLEEFIPIHLELEPEVHLQLHNEFQARLALISFIVAIVLFLIIAIFCLRDMTKKEIAKSAAIVVIYAIIRTALLNIFISLGFVAGIRFVINTIADLPFSLYQAIGRIGFILSTYFDFYDLYLSIERWPFQAFGIVSFIILVLPFIFVFVGKKEQNVFLGRYDWYLNA
jgi:hypothetical protein